MSANPTLKFALNMKKAIIMASIAGLTFPLYAQNPNALNQPTNGNNTSNNRSQPSNDTHTRSRQKRTNSPYGQDIPIFSPEDETIQFMGKNISIGDSRIGDQFGGYLVMDQAKIEEAAKYRKIMRQILDTLDRTAKGTRAEKLRKAYDLLKEASQYPADAKISESLQNAIIMAQLSINKGSKNNKIIEQLKLQNEKHLRELSFMEDKTPLSTQSSTPGQGQGQAQSRVQNRTDVKYIDKVKKRTLNEAAIRKRNLDSTIAGKLGKIQYQAFLTQIFAQRRFEHVVIGCRFYNLLFSDGENKLSIKKKSDLDKLFTETFGVNPTVAGLDSAANMFIGKSTELAGAARNHLKRGQVHAGTQRMLEAYFIGQHLTPIHTFSPADRDRMSQYINDSKHLKDAVNVKSWNDAAEYVDKLKAQATDFRHLKAATAITGFKNLSNTYLTSYKVAIAEGKNDDAEYNLGNAIDYWPNNPKFEEVNNALTAKVDKAIAEAGRNGDTLENSTRDFKALILSEDYRGVTTTRAGAYVQVFKFAMVSKRLSEAERETYQGYHKKAKDLFEGAKAIERALETAKGFEQQNQFEMAWEELKQERANEHLDYTKIDEKLLELNTKVPEYSKLFTEAETLTKSGDLGSALSRYIKAQSLNPASKMAPVAIKDLLKQRSK